MKSKKASRIIIGLRLTAIGLLVNATGISIAIEKLISARVERYILGIGFVLIFVGFLIITIEDFRRSASKC